MRSALWRDRGFVKLWAAQSISQLGSQVSLLALPLTALFVLKSSALGVSLLRSFGFLPFVVFSLPAGVWIDRLRRRPLMIAADAGRALAMASIPVAYWLGHVTLAQLYIVAAIHGVLSVMFDVSYLSFLPGLVSREKLGEANAKLLGSQSVAQVVGPSIAGALVGAVGAADDRLLRDRVERAARRDPAGAAPHPTPVIVAGGFAGTIVGFFTNMNQLTFRQTITPAPLLGRMNSVVRFMYWGTIPVGSALGGVVAGPLGLRTTLVAAALGSTAACIPSAASPIRSATVTGDAGTAGDGSVATPAQ